MPYGIIKIDTITFTDGGVDKSVSISGLVQNPTFSGNITVTGTVSGNTIQGQTVSGVTVTGTTSNFASGVFTTQISGATVTGNVGSFTTITGGTVTLTSGVFGAGTASAPSIAFTGDLNTGIYSPGADQVAISTGGSGRLFVDASGNVGIGTSSLTSGAGRTYLTLGGTTLGSIALKNASNAEVLYIQTGSASVDHYMSVAGYQAFWTNNSERLRITSAGLVGVGTSSPSGLFDARGFSYLSGAQIRDSSHVAKGYVQGDARGFLLATDGATNIAFDVNGTERMRLDSSGRLGVGTTSPNALLTVGAAYGGTPNSESRTVIQSAGNSYLTIGAGSSSQAGLLFADTAANNAGGILYTHSSDSLEFNAAGNERLRIDSSGRVGIGTSSPNAQLDVRRGDAHSVGLFTQTNASFNCDVAFEHSSAPSTFIASRRASGDFWLYQAGAHNIVLSTNSTERVRIDSSGRVGIGTTSPAQALSIGGVSSTPADFKGLAFQSGSTEVNYVRSVVQDGSNYALSFGTYNSSLSEKVRIDSSGRLLVGTSSARSNFFNFASTITPRLQLEGTDYSSSIASLTCNNNSENAILVFARSNGSTTGSNTVVTNNTTLGMVNFQGSDGSEFVEAAHIKAEVDGTPGANDMPGRLVFSTTADGASSPTERMRIKENGQIFFGKTSDGFGITGFQFRPTTDSFFTTSGTNVLALNRLTNDGNILEFAQDSTVEGSVSVSGTTVSYNGAHLSRWSQLPGGAERTEILRGSVLSNIDEMCEWTDEENEQLNRMKVSDIEGDKNVSGVFQAWDDDDDTYTNDFYCAMTGDFIIRIAAGVTVERGDLLMSAGDGTAKPQDDDIIRSKTIAKVTSTNVSCTYDDGSYCVPCVLMAC